MCCIPEQNSCDSGEMTHLYLFSPFSSVRLLIPRQERYSSSMDPKNVLWIEVTRSHYNAPEESTRRSRKNIRALRISCIKILGKTLPVVLDTTRRLQCRCYRLGQGNLSFRLLRSTTTKNIKNYRNYSPARLVSSRIWERDPEYKSFSCPNWFNPCSSRPMRTRPESCVSPKKQAIYSR